MSEYKIISSGHRKYILTLNEASLGELEFAKWSQSKGTITMKDGTVYILASKGVWKRAIEILDNGVALFSLKLSFRHGLIINSFGGTLPAEYRLKHKGFWKPSQVLRDGSGQELLEIKTRYRWKGFNTEYLITPSVFFDKTIHKELLLFACICGIKQQEMAAVAAAT